MTKKAKMKREPKHYTEEITVADAIGEGCGELLSLGEEMRSWADAIEEKFSGTSKYDNICEVADVLEGVNEPEVAAELKDLKVTVTRTRYGRRGPSRATRRDDATYLLQVAKDLLENFEEESENAEAASALADELDQIINEAEGIGFPGMYG